MPNPDPRRWWTLFAMAGALSMFMIDGTGISVALPSIQRAFSLPQSNLQWVVTGLPLALATTVAAGGRFGDGFGRVRVFTGGLLLFVIGSITCAAAPDFTVLVIGRVLEGVAAGLMMPAAAVLVTEAFDPKERGRAMGIYTGISSIFMAMGPIISGALVEFIGWRAVFLVSIPISVVVLVLVRVAKPFDPPVAVQSFRVGSTLLLMAGITSLVYGLQESHGTHVSPVITLGLMAVGVLILAAFATIQLRLAEPLLNVRMFFNRAFAADAIVLYCAQFALIGQSAFIAIYLQSILHFPPMQAGLSMLLLLIPWMFMAPVGGLLFDRFGLKVPVVLGMTLITLGFLLETQTFPTRNFTWVAPCMVMIGAGLGLTLPQTYTDGMSRVPASERGQAYGLLDTVRQLGNAMGMAVIGMMIAAQELPQLGPIADRNTHSAVERAELEPLLLGTIRGQEKDAHAVRDRWPIALDELKQSAAQSIADGYFLGTGVTAIGLVAVIFMMRSRKK
ncbi:MAG: DHA2 family efflux MFS transporter permease subunit [Planctomycetes bacterium]|nr:DHA2 family efflux MFS transporter permease subunit [Planctomycetota bacterium]